jgi:hypothetical protein
MIKNIGMYVIVYTDDKITGQRTTFFEGLKVDNSPCEIWFTIQPKNEKAIRLLERHTDFKERDYMYHTKTRGVNAERDGIKLIKQLSTILDNEND